LNGAEGGAKDKGTMTTICERKNHFPGFEHRARHRTEGAQGFLLTQQDQNRLPGGDGEGGLVPGGTNKRARAKTEGRRGREEKGRKGV